MSQDSHLKTVLYLISYIQIFLAPAYLLPFLIALIFREPFFLSCGAYLLPAAIHFGLGYPGWKRARGSGFNMHTKDLFLAIGCTWWYVSIVSAIPYMFLLEGAQGNAWRIFSMGVFESMSGFTTTGATITNPIEGQRTSLLTWRAMTQWLGGFGLILLALFVMVRLTGRTDAYMALLDEGGHRGTTPMGAIKAALYVYLALTLAETVILFVVGLIAGVDLTIIDALTHTFTTLSTGGFSTRNTSIAAFDSLAIEIVLIFFMLLGGINFLLIAQVTMRRWNFLRENEELRWYMTAWGMAVVLVVANLVLSNVYSIGEGIRHSIFTVSSIMTTTGYATEDYAQWPAFSIMILLVMMAVGGMVGSTAGGIKIARLIVVYKRIHIEVRRLIHPHEVRQVTINGQTLDDETVNRIVALFALYLVLVPAFAAIMLLLEPSFDIMSAASSILATMFVIGPGAGRVGPSHTWEFMNTATLWFLAFCMWIGKMEVLGAMAMLVRR